jgi:hypothetical protein
VNAKKDELSVSPETVERLAKEGARANGGESMGNLLSAIGNNVAGAIAEKEQEVASLVTRVRELNHEIAILKTHEQIGSETT